MAEANARPHPSMLQMYGLSPVCVRICTLRIFDVVKDCVHPSKGHLNGRSPAIKTKINAGEYKHKQNQDI